MSAFYRISLIVTGVFSIVSIISFMFVYPAVDRFAYDSVEHDLLQAKRIVHEAFDNTTPSEWHGLSIEVSEQIDMAIYIDKFSDNYIPEQYIEQFKNDLLSTIKSNSTMIYFNISNAKNGAFHILNGGEKGSDQFTQTQSTFNNLDKLGEFYNSFRNSLEENDILKKRNFHSVSKHQYYGNSNKKGFQWMVHKKKNANIIYIYISKEVINSEPDYYYPIIKILGDNIKEHLI